MNFIESQTKRLCEEVDKYAQKLGYIAGPTKENGETIPGESVPVEITIHPGHHKLTFSKGELICKVKITNNPDGDPLGFLVIFPCGGHLIDLTKFVVRSVVHSLFDHQ